MNRIMGVLLRLTGPTYLSGRAGSSCFRIGSPPVPTAKAPFTRLVARFTRNAPPSPARGERKRVCRDAFRNRPLGREKSKRPGVGFTFCVAMTAIRCPSLRGDRFFHCGRLTLEMLCPIPEQHPTSFDAKPDGRRRPHPAVITICCPSGANETESPQLRANSPV